MLLLNYVIATSKTPCSLHGARKRMRRMCTKKRNGYVWQKIEQW